MKAGRQNGEWKDVEPDAGADLASPTLDLRGVWKRFGPVVALRDVSLALRPAEVLGLVGDNGAGKSTLVEIISGGVQPSEGEILVDGIPRLHQTPREARQSGIETVHQNLSLISTLNITENVYLNRESFGQHNARRWIRWMDRREMHRNVADGLARLSLELPPLRTKVAALSGGQRQAVAIARAVLWGSHIVLLDEPTAALGVRQTEIVLSFIETLKKHGVAVIVISHNMEQVLRVADRIVVLRLGKKVADVAREDVDAAQLVAYITGAR